MKHSCIDLFCGAGGFSLGMIKAGWKVVCGIDNSTMVLSTYWCNLATDTAKWIGDRPSDRSIKRWLNGKFPPERTEFQDCKTVERVICDDIKNIDGKQLLKDLHLKELGLLIGGPPCQGFSTANVKRCVDDPRSKLMWEFIRLVDEIQPKIFMFENVPGILSYRDFVYILMEDLEKKGYCVRINMIDCCSYGVPQHRKRVFIQGVRNDLKLEPTYPTPSHFDKKMLEFNDNGVSIADVAVGSFARHGFPKEAVRDKKLWWNKTLQLYMNKDTASQVVTNAEMCCMIERITKIRDEDENICNGIKALEVGI